MPQRVTAETWWGDELALIENVPAWVCQQCGEHYFDAETSLRLDRVPNEGSAPLRTLPVPVYRFNAA